jgi:hypothetical protein
MSDINPSLWPLPALAASVKSNRCAAPLENPYRRIEKAASDMIIAGLDLFRDVRDAMLESQFFQIYGPPAVLGVVEGHAAENARSTPDPRDLPIVQEALASIGQGGYPEAIALIGALVGRGAGRISLARLELVDRLVRSDKVLSRIPAEEVRRIKSEQAVIAELEPERALESLSKLLVDPADRRRALAVLDEVVAAVEFTAEQLVVLDRVRAILGGKESRKEKEWPDMAERELAGST